MRSIILFLFTLCFFLPLQSLAEKTTEIAIFAGGCFWCTQADFDKVKGVIKTVVGYTGGTDLDPNYEKVSSQQTGHYEAVQIFYDPTKVNYPYLLKVFWHNVDPTDARGQFCDKGSSYRSAIFYQGDKQRKQAEDSKNELIKSRRFKQIVTQILPARHFYSAEEYHQKYYQKNPIRYKFYRYTCGRDARLHEIWIE